LKYKRHISVEMTAGKQNW